MLLLLVALSPPSHKWYLTIPKYHYETNGRTHQANLYHGHIYYHQPSVNIILHHIIYYHQLYQYHDNKPHRDQNIPHISANTSKTTENRELARVFSNEATASRPISHPIITVHPSPLAPNPHKQTPIGEPRQIIPPSSSSTTLPIMDSKTNICPHCSLAYSTKLLLDLHISRCSSKARFEVGCPLVFRNDLSLPKFAFNGLTENMSYPAFNLSQSPVWF